MTPSWPKSLRHGHAAIHLAWAALAIAAAPAALCAQKPAAVSHQHIEIIGLHRWTRQMIEDSLAAHFTGADASLESHACAANLKKIGFAAASVQAFIEPDRSDNPDSWAWLITVVEPEDSMRVQPIARFADSLPDRPEWEAIRAAVAGGPSGTFRFYKFMPAAQFYPLYATRKHQRALDNLKRLGAPSGVASVYPMLARYRSPSDLTTALRALASDGNPDNRVIAAAILANFPASDSTWWGLVRALRDPQDMVASMAAASLGGLSEAHPRPIDWAPEGRDLRAIFGGTDPWHLATLIEVLLRTHVSTTLAPIMLRDNAELVASYAVSSVPQVASPARELLKLLSGRDFGDDRSAWIAWANGLPR